MTSRERLIKARSILVVESMNVEDQTKIRFNVEAGASKLFIPKRKDVVWPYKVEQSRAEGQWTYSQSESRTYY
jgi:hypothetical protein